MKHQQQQQQLANNSDDENHRQSESFLPKPPVAPRQNNSLGNQQQGHNNHIPPLPSAPPPSYNPMVNYTMVHPPPYNFAQHVYDAIEPKKGNWAMFFVALLELGLGLTAWSIAVACAAEPSLQYYTPLYTGCWATSFYLINAVLGIIAAKRNTTNFFVAHIVFSVLSIVCSIILVTLSLLNWTAAGTVQEKYKWEKTEKLLKDRRTPWRDIDSIPRDYCVSNELLHEKLSVLNQIVDRLDPANCLYAFKLGITFNILLVILALVLGVLNIVSVVLCFMRTCDCSGRLWRRR